MADKFIKLTKSDDNTTVVINTRHVVKAHLDSEDDEYTTVVMADEYADIEVNETPEKVYKLLNGYISLDKKPEAPKVASAVVNAESTIVSTDPNYEYHK